MNETRASASPIHCRQQNNSMKELQILLFILLFFAFNSLGQGKTKNDTLNSSNIKSNKLVGTWRLIEYADLDTLMAKIQRATLPIPQLTLSI